MKLMLAPASRACCRGLRGSNQPLRLPRSVRAVQLPQRYAEQPGWDEASYQRLYDEAYRRGYEEGLLKAQQQQVALAAATQMNVAQAAVAVPAQYLHQQQPKDTNPCGCQDSLLRSAVKGMSWRIFSTSMTMLLAYFVLGGANGGMKWRDMLRLGGMEFVMKYVTYLIHERIWATLKLVK